MMLTIFTPTYNRAKLIERVYNSLVRQTKRDFEWLVIDDGSLDDTEQVIERLIKENKIKIKYIKKKNGGKHTAHNEALKYAEGDYFVCLDSDDILADSAIERIVRHLDCLREHDCGFIAYKSNFQGNLLSEEFSIKSDKHWGLVQLSQRYGVCGEFAFVFKTDVIKKYPYPVIEEEHFVGECVLYDKLEIQGYTWCPLAEVIEFCEYQEEGLSNNFYKLLYDNPVGYALYHAQRIELVHSLMGKIRHGISYNAFYRIARIKKHPVTREVNFITTSTWILGQLGAVYYFIKNSR